jgi:ketosteroid isomerase-like protein
MKKRLPVSLFLLCLPLCSLSQAPTPEVPIASLTATAAPAAEDPAHNELRAVRDGVLAAIKKGDIEAELAFLHPNVVVTWQNAEVSRGREGVRAYLDRMLEGPGKIVESYSVDLDVDELSILYGGDTALSWGKSREHIGMAHERSLDYPGRWSATLVREGGQWLIANLHVSTNIFANPLLEATKKVFFIAGGIAIVIALVLGYFWGRRRKAAP